MEKHITHTKALSRFIQILDSSFPSGGFVHSFGLEPHIVLERVKNGDDLKQFLENILIYQYQKFEFAYAKKCYELFEKDKLNLIIKEDLKYSAMLSFEYAKASKVLGENYLKHLNFDIKKEIVKNYFESVKKREAKGNEIILLVAYSYDIGLDVESFLLLWVKKNLMNIAFASLKISRIKPTEIQKILFGFDDELEERIKESLKISNFNPLFEEVIYQHKNLEPKLFMT
jgi:urease accessory protein